MQIKCLGTKEFFNVRRDVNPHYYHYLYTDMTAVLLTWNLFVLYNDQKRKRPIHIHASYRLTVRRFVLV